MLRITGYSDKYTAFPGEEIKFYVNSEKNENYDVQISPVHYLYNLFLTFQKY